MKTIIDQIEGSTPVREYPTTAGRLGVTRAAKRRQNRSVALEFAITGLWSFLLLLALYVVVGGLIGAVRGMWYSVNDLCLMFLRFAGRA